MRFAWLLLFIPCGLWSMLVGNPGQPIMQKCGVLQSSPSWWSLRAGYLSDLVYRSKFKDEFPCPEGPNASSYVQLSTDAALLTLNLKNVFDFYGIVGSSSLQLDREVYTNREFAWGVGGKFIFYKTGSVRVGADIKYFETEQKPLYFVCEGLPYNIESHFHLKYTEIQAAMGIAYRIRLLSPYVQLTYLISELDPLPYTAAVRLPQAGFGDTPVDITSKSVTGSRRWGLVVGATIISGSKGSLTLESRMFNQNAIDITGEIRF